MSGRRYARTSRVNELLREIIAEELERIGDERLELVTISGVDTDAGLETAVVYYSSLAGAEGDEEIVVALDDHRWKLQRQIGRQARLRSTPVLTFEPDAGIRAGARIEEILRDIHDGDGDGVAADDERSGGDPTSPSVVDSDDQD